MYIEKFANAALILNPLYQVGLTIHEFHEKTDSTDKVAIVAAAIFNGILVGGLSFYLGRSFLISAVWGVSGFVAMPILTAVCWKVTCVVYENFSKQKNNI